MSLITKNLETNGRIIAQVPTSSFSGRLTDVAADSINPYTSTGPGPGGTGLTYDEVNGDPDPDFSNVGLLLGMDGSNGSTTFVDSSNDNKSATVFGNAQLATDIVKFGSAAGKFDGSGDYLTYAADADFGFASSDFTLEAWVYLGDPALSGNYRILFATTSQRNTYYGIRYHGGTNVVLTSYDGSSVVEQPTGTSPKVALSDWTHIAYSRESGTLRGYINGTQVMSGSFNTATSTSSGFAVGASPQYYGALYNWVGRVDEVRVTKGVARYTTGFTPATEAWPRF